MIWNVNPPPSTAWNAGDIRLDVVLYELERPTIFMATIGLSKFLFLKKDELEVTDIYIACVTSSHEAELLKRGRLSVRGALSNKEAWILETDLDLNVVRFQESSALDIERLLPPHGVGLMSKFGVVPDTTEEALSFMAFKFSSHSMSTGSMPLSIFKELVDGVSSLVRHALVPSALTRGRDGRFFDVQIGQPQFASLLITIQSANIDEQGLRSYKRTQNLVADDLRQDTTNKGLTFWNSVESTRSLATQRELSRQESSQYKEVLGQIVRILPSEENDLDRLEVTFRGVNTSNTLFIDKKLGDRLIRAQQLGKSARRSITGTIIEINGEAKTFIIKRGDRLTTCAPSAEIFHLMDENEILERGQKLKIDGDLWKRKRRDYISFNSYPEVL